MRITVIGSTGRTGRLVLAEGLRRGHEVVAFTRRPHDLPDPPDPAAPHAVVAGDGRDAERVRAAVEGADAVISTVSGGDRADPHRAAEVTGTVTAAMRDLGVRRLVVTSAYPIVAERPRVPLWLLRRVFARAYADAARMEREVSSSDLDWTVVRLNRLTDRPATGTVHASRDLLARPRPTARADAAAVLLDLAEDPGAARVALNVT